MRGTTRGAAARGAALSSVRQAEALESRASERSQGSAMHGPALHSEHTKQLSEMIDSDQPLSCTRTLAMNVLFAPSFDYVLGIIIVANMFIMIVEIDGSAEEEQSTSSGPSWTEVCGWIALTIFVLELLLRLFVLRCLFWKDSWNVFDFIVVIVDVTFSIIGLVIGDAFPVSILRIFRLAKLARVSKVLRIFPELRLLLHGLVGSIRAIFWGVVLLLFVLIVWSMVAVLFIHPLVKDLDCERCADSYDTVFHATLTFWQQIIAGDSWGQLTVLIIKMYPSTIIIFMPLFMSVGMAVLNLILGVVVNVAINSKDAIAHEDSLEKKMLKMEQRTHLLELCHHMDVEKTGRVNREEVFAKFAEPGDFRKCLESMDIKEEDLYIIWSLLDHEKTGSLPYKMLMNKLYSVRETDTEFMLAYIKYFISSIRNDLLHSMSGMEAKMDAGLQKVETEFEEVFEEVKEDKAILRQISRETFEIKEAQRHDMGNQECGAWQVLDENKQKLTSVRDTPKTDRKDICPCSPRDNSCERLEANVALQASNPSAASTSVNDGRGLPRLLVMPKGDWASSARSGASTVSTI